jgi:hypothetical protein
MPADHQERLDEMRAELARQDAAWARARRVLAELGDVMVLVPSEILETIDASTRVPTAREPGVRA